jgi:peptidoglycan/xylan/chitin deacetylase (PgdA/CDA1 family)
MSRSLCRVARTRYPSLLFGAQKGEDRLPAFLYHDVDAEDFERDLEFLARNGYRALSADEYVGMKLNAETDKAVFLTSDDARRNFFDVAFPLLQQYGVKAALFVPARSMTPSREDGTRIQRDDLPARMFMKWEELLTCSESGLVDVQSRAHRHALVYTAGRLAGFCTPELIARH